jgi:hypothetical protein
LADATVLQRVDPECTVPHLRTASRVRTSNAEDRQRRSSVWPSHELDGTIGVGLTAVFDRQQAFIAQDLATQQSVNRAYTAEL